MCMSNNIERNKLAFSSKKIHLPDLFEVVDFFERLELGCFSTTSTTCGLGVGLVREEIIDVSVAICFLHERVKTTTRNIDLI